MKKNVVFRSEHGVDVILGNAVCVVTVTTPFCSLVAVFINICSCWCLYTCL